LSIKTIESHRANLKVKLQASNATDLLRHAINWVQSEKPSSDTPPRVELSPLPRKKV